MPAIGDLVHQTSSTTGTGNLTLAAVNGKQTFASVFSTGGTDVFYYFASNRNAAEWEVGTGHMSDSTTLVRDTVLASSNANAAVNFTTGTLDIANDLPASLQVNSADLGTMAAEDAADYLTAAGIAAAYQPLDSDLTSWAAVTRASGFDTWVASPTSANLRALLTDETGTGALYFAGGNAGTPSAITLTNGTGLPVSGIAASTSAALGVGSIELGHASDTTIARASAGVVTIEGSTVLVSGGALGTPASATLTNATGLPVSGITASTSTALGVGSIELGHASDTTLSRASAGRLAVEGVNVPTISSTDILTNKRIKDTRYVITDGAAFEVDPANGAAQEVTLGANRTPKATNFADGDSIVLSIDDGTARTMTWTDTTWGGSGVIWKTDSGSAPTLATTGWTDVVLYKRNGQVYGARVGNNA
jgi:hypothetical protein